MIDSILHRLDIHPGHFRILVRLFHTLSERKEILNQQLGFNGKSLTAGAILFGVLGTVVAIVLIIGKPTSAEYLTAFSILTAFVLGSVLMAETAHTLVNPEEGLVLVHQPVSGATYTAAKLVHLARVVAYIVVGLNLIPALAGMAARDHWRVYPVYHMSVMLAIGVGMALACCALFGWLMRYIPPRRMKAAAQIASALSYLVVMPQFGILGHLRAFAREISGAGPWVTVALAVAAPAVVVLGLRALSADYLIRVTGLVQGGSGKQKARRRNRGLFALPGKAVSRWCGGPAARAGFAYMVRMMGRDWQFRRQLAGFLPSLVIAAAATRSFDSPFGGEFSTVHVLPHSLGLMAFFVCSILLGGSHHKAVWVFDLAPAGAFPSFANGVYAGLWTILVLAPHTVAVPAMLWFWPLRDAIVFAMFSVAVVTLYLSVLLFLVDGLPFGHEPQASQPASMLGALMAGGMAAALAVAVQHHYLFRWHGLAMAAAAAVGCAAALFGRKSIQGLTVAIQYYLARNADRRGMFLTSGSSEA